jgi:cephalosporin hydroxylase
MRLPPTVTVDMHAPALDYFKRRAAQSIFDTYAGIQLLKFPEDLRTYEHLLWSENVEVVLELGVQNGGSTLWFRDRLRTLASYGRIRAPRVIGVDLDVSHAQGLLSEVDPGWQGEIMLIAGDLLDEALVQRVHDLMPPESSCLVIDDSAHTHETTLGEEGKKERARQYFREGAQWMDAKMPHNPDLHRPRAEAAALLELNDSPKAEKPRH